MIRPFNVISTICALGLSVVLKVNTDSSNICWRERRLFILIFNGPIQLCRFSYYKHMGQYPDNELQHLLGKGVGVVALVALICFRHFIFGGIPLKRGGSTSIFIVVVGMVVLLLNFLSYATCYYYFIKHIDVAGMILVETASSIMTNSFVFSYCATISMLYTGKLLDYDCLLIHPSARAQSLSRYRCAAACLIYCIFSCIFFSS